MYCRLSRSSTARGSCTSLVIVGPTKYIILLCAKVIETTKSNTRFRYWHKFDAAYGHCKLLGLQGVLQILLIMLRASKRKIILQRRMLKGPALISLDLNLY